jgi:hypothetical protein
LLSKNIKIKVYRTLVLPLVLYGCETWPFTLTEGHRLRVFENRVLRRIFGSRKDKATGEWRGLHNEELCDAYSSRNTIWVIKSRRMRWEGHVVRMGERRGAYKVLMVKRERKKPLGRPRRRWKEAIKMDLQEVAWGMGWIDLV